MPRNVEIKAKVGEFDVVLEAAENLSGGPPELIQQEDIFFNADRGRLKLRILTPLSGQLIFYQREDVRGPKTCTYNIVETDNPYELRALLANAYGEKIVVRKLRRLFLVGRTRIHLDTVENLGEFLELEVVLGEGEQVQVGEQEAIKLMVELGIASAALVEGAYADLLARPALPV